MKRLILTAIALGLLALPATAQDAKRKFINVAGDVYLFQNNFHQSLIVATPEGTVRVDPINEAASSWLDENLSQIGAKPVSHLIYSHSHGDHASGGAVHDGAETIMHKDAPDMIDGVAATQRVGDSHSFNLGGKTFELTNLGAGHDNHMLAVVVRPENVGFIVDVAAPRRLPFRTLGGANMDDWIGQIKTAQTLDFEHFAPGHGPIGTKADLDDALDYMLDLKAGVLAGLKAGKTVEQVQSDLMLEKYKDWIQYDGWRTENIQGMASYLVKSGQVE
jgi:glyoxylase-like metal-dependent hydrolase (beta-lactamase superfamily II)